MLELGVELVLELGLVLELELGLVLELELELVLGLELGLVLGLELGLVLELGLGNILIGICHSVPGEEQATLHHGLGHMARYPTLDIRPSGTSFPLHINPGMPPAPFGLRCLALCY